MSRVSGLRDALAAVRHDLGRAREAESVEAARAALGRNADYVLGYHRAIVATLEGVAHRLELMVAGAERAE